MPWVGMPPFRDGMLLSATHLNAWTNNVQHLQGLVSGVQQPQYCVANYAHSHVYYYWIWHRLRYFHYKFEILSEPADQIEIKYNDVQIYYINNPIEGTYSGYVDLDGVTPALEYGGYYEIELNSDMTAGDRRHVFHYLEERDSTT